MPNSTGSTPHIALMRQEDIPDCLRVVAASWTGVIAQQAHDDLRDAFLRPRYAPVYYVAHLPGCGIIGMSGYVTSCLNWGILDLIYVCTMPEYRRQGIASRLIRRCLSDADALGCAVMLTTYVPDVYRRHGFDVIDPEFDCAGKNNVLMRRRAGGGGQHDR